MCLYHHPILKSLCQMIPDSIAQLRDSIPSSQHTFNKLNVTTQFYHTANLFSLTWSRYDGHSEAISIGQCAYSGTIQHC